MDNEDNDCSIDAFFDSFYEECSTYSINEFRGELETLKLIFKTPDLCLIDRVIDRPDLLQVLIDEYYDDVETFRVMSRYVEDARNPDYMNMIQMLINNGLDIYKHEETILFECAKNGSIELMQFFINNGLDLLKYEKKGILACANNMKMMEFLLNDKLDINACNGNTLLNVCKRHNLNVNMVRFLLERGADPNLNNGQELFFAIKYCSQECILLLLQYGADINLLNNYILSKLSISTSASTKIDRIMLDNGLDPLALSYINRIDKRQGTYF